jgi:nucleoside phosphorylase
MAIDFPSTVDFGIVTALPIEYAALRHLLEHQRSRVLPHDPSLYLLGELPSSRSGRSHVVALTVLSGDGTRNAAAACTSLLAGFPTIRTIVMVGIAGGIPAIHNAGKHVRLGDIVVATEIIDYGHLRAEDGSLRLRGGLDGPSADLRHAERILQAGQDGGELPWETWLGAGPTPVPARFTRPDDSTDIVYADGVAVAHPDDTRYGRRPGFPRVHRGIVASGDVLIRDATERERIAVQYGVCAVEMEAAGVAAASKQRSVPWFMVRGIADYCDGAKNDLWHPYASLAAAAYLRALLAKCPPAEDRGVLELRPTEAELAHKPITNGYARVLPGRRTRADSPIHYLHVIVDAILDIEELLDNGSRRMLVAMLPRNIQMSIAELASPRLQVISIVRTCAAFRDGQYALLTALRACVPEGSIALERAEVTIANHWHGLID